MRGGNTFCDWTLSLLVAAKLLLPRKKHNYTLLEIIIVNASDSMGRRRKTDGFDGLTCYSYTVETKRVEFPRVVSRKIRVTGENDGSIFITPLRFLLKIIRPLAGPAIN